jgi:hypothetical protein
MKDIQFGVVRAECCCPSCNLYVEDLNYSLLQLTDLTILQLLGYFSIVFAFFSIYSVISFLFALHFHFLPSFPIYFTSSPLWFVLYLFLISITARLLRKESTSLASCFSGGCSNKLFSTSQGDCGNCERPFLPRTYLDFSKEVQSKQITSCCVLSPIAVP